MTFQGGVGVKRSLTGLVPKRMARDEGDTEGQENSFEESHSKGEGGNR